MQVASSQKTIYVCACSTPVVALCEVLEILSVPQSQLAGSVDVVGFLRDVEHEDGGR